VDLALIVGNPNPKSRTLLLAEAVGDAVGAIVSETNRLVIDLIDVASELFDPKSSQVSALTDAVARCDIVIVASPTYKATYTGLLKAFLDRYGTNALAGITAIPVMTGGSLAHSLAPDFTLRPLLVELGASVPTRSLFFVTSEMAELPEIVGNWARDNRVGILGAAQPATRSMRGGSDLDPNVSESQ
jgi:FMN reductase